MQIISSWMNFDNRNDNDNLQTHCRHLFSNFLIDESHTTLLKIEHHSFVNWLPMIFHTRSPSRQRFLTILPKYRSSKRIMRITEVSRSFTMELQALLFLLSDIYNFDEIMLNLCTTGYHLIVSWSRVIWHTQISLLKNPKYHNSLW